MRSFVLNATRALLETSTRGSKSYCVLANAARHGYDAYSVSVTAEGIRFNLRDGNRYYFPLPARSVIKFKKWDEGGEVQPFKVMLAAKQGYMRPISRPGPRARPYKARVTKGRKMKGPTHCDRRFAGLAVIAKKHGHSVAAHKQM